ncbi:MAG: YlmH/Sll1252 family protein [Clostridiaceae bacterium]|nr:YlmH/Sll1252 family protein [Clostridiaceae bacterium]
MPEYDLTDRLADLARQAGDRGVLKHTRFLSPAEQESARIWLKKNRVRHAFNGGFDGAERQVCFLMSDDSGDEGPDETDLDETIVGLCLTAPAKPARLSHRDYLGSLLALGIQRDQLGDILVDENRSTVLVLASMASFIENNLERVGSLPVQINPVPLKEIKIPERMFTSFRITVASLRLDKITAAGFGLSRADAADLIRSGAVQVNWKEEQRVDREVPVGAVLSLRGRGRIRLASEEGLSRKDRHILVLERYE